MELLLTHVIRSFILPPGLFLTLLLLGFVLRLRFYRTGQVTMYTAVALLLLLSMPIIVQPLLHGYESVPALKPESLRNSPARAIVILGGGRYPDAPEYQGDTVAEPTLERLRYGAWLQAKIKLPILVSGGVVNNDQRPPEAQLMQQVLEHEFRATVTWVESRSHTTYENAIFSRLLLEKAGIKNIILVTHAIHMPRASEAFAKAGFNVTPAPMGFDTGTDIPTILRLLPSVYSLFSVRELMNEVLGRAWYHLRYY